MKKEWKGNSDSVRTRLGVNKKHTTKDREQDDFYATDPKALEALLDHSSTFLQSLFLGIKSGYKKIYYNGNKYIDDPKLGRITLGCRPYIWECACGTGNLAEVLKKRGYDVVCSDLKDRGYGRPSMLNVDFLQNYDFPIRYNVGVILTNPPYSLANEFILHALDILPEGGVYIALMNITYLAGQKRHEQIYRWGTLREVYIFTKRIDCWRNNVRQSDNTCRMVDFAWYVFQKGYAGQPTLYWL